MLPKTSQMHMTFRPQRIILKEQIHPSLPVGLLDKLLDLCHVGLGHPHRDCDQT